MKSIKKHSFILLQNVFSTVRPHLYLSEGIFRSNVTSSIFQIKEMKFYVDNETKYTKLYCTALNIIYILIVNHRLNRGHCLIKNVNYSLLSANRSQYS
jgi:hypothetical protein